MEIRIKIEKKGNAVGTLGWLLENAAVIYIGTTTTNNQGAWLRDHSGKNLTVLCVRGYNYDAKIVHADNGPANDGWLTTDIIFTDAAFSIIQQMQAIAAAAMNESETAEAAENLVVSVA